MQIDCTFHIGSHGSMKRIAKVLDQETQGLLEQFGTKIFDLKQLYPDFDEMVGPNKREAAGAWRTEVGKELEGFIVREAENLSTQTAFFFDEQIIGNLRGITNRGTIFPTTLTNIRRIPEAFNSPRTRVSIAIEPYDRLFERALSHLSYEEQCQIKERLLLLPRTWADVVADIKKHLPMCEISVWNFDAAYALPFELEYTLLGTQLSTFQNKPKGKRKPKNKGIWNQAENDYLAECFSQDVIEINDRWPGSCLMQNET